MLHNCKISQYKIKKIIKCFSEDLTSAEASKLLNMNIKTTNRYYNNFRKLLLDASIMMLKTNLEKLNYIGWMKSSYYDKCFFNIYKKDEKTFFCTKSIEKPTETKYAIDDNDFKKYTSFIHKRLKKFHGFTQKNYFYQVFESGFRYNYNNEELFKLIWKLITKKNSPIITPECKNILHTKLHS